MYLSVHQNPKDPNTAKPYLHLQLLLQDNVLSIVRPEKLSDGHRIGPLLQEIH